MRPVLTPRIILERHFWHPLVDGKRTKTSDGGWFVPEIISRYASADKDPTGKKKRSHEPAEVIQKVSWRSVSLVHTTVAFDNCL